VRVRDLTFGALAVVLLVGYIVVGQRVAPLLLPSAAATPTPARPTGNVPAPTIGGTIAFVLRNLPVFLFVAAIVLAGLNRSGGTIAERLLAWILLLPIGVTGLWAAVFHLFFPEIAAKDIGWEPSPFQFEVGMADLAMGAAACLSFWRSLDFKAAVVVINAIFLLGDAIGHVGQMIVAGNFAPGNAGVPFLGDLILPVLSLILLIIVQRSEAAARIS